ncbi:MAG: sulfite exporter TauE/SafE family protein [archaeon]|nr:sulfite exporter TauE/SafE family protein [archaeon]
MLILASIYLIAKPLKEQGLKTGSYYRRLVDYQGNVYEYSFKLASGLLLSFGVGFFSSIFGIGGGIIHVPAMILLLGLPTHISTATSHFILVFSSLVGSSTHALLGNVNLDFAILMGLGAVIGAQFGALISRITKGTIIERLLGLALIIVAVRFLLQAL